jgi:hypothetical protein
MRTSMFDSFAAPSARERTGGRCMEAAVGFEPTETLPPQKFSKLPP